MAERSPLRRYVLAACLSGMLIAGQAQAQRPAPQPLLHDGLALQRSLVFCVDLFLRDARVVDALDGQVDAMRLAQERIGFFGGLATDRLEVPLHRAGASQNVIAALRDHLAWDRLFPRRAAPDQLVEHGHDLRHVHCRHAGDRAHAGRIGTRFVVTDQSSPMRESNEAPAALK